MTNKEKFDLLKKICQKKFRETDGNDIQKKRIVEELKFFNEHPSLVNDVIYFLKHKKIGGDLNNPNSYLFYLLGITNKEPDYSKEFTFIFEVDEDNKRMSPPDIDIDFEHRESILQHVCDLYGTEKVGLIGTAQAYKPRAAVQSAAKALDITGTAKEGDQKFSSENFQEAVRLSKLIPELPGVSLGEFLGHPKINKKTGEKEYFSPPNNKVKDAMKSIQDEAKRYPEVFELALKLEGMFKNFSTHAAGVVISSNNITDDVPLQRLGKKKKDKSDYEEEETLMSTQFDMEDIEDIGLLKFDFLQIDTLRQIRLCENLILQTRGIDKLPFDLDYLETNDKNVFDTINKNRLEGLFQISGDIFCGKEYPLRNFETGEFLRDDKGKIKTRRQAGLMEVIGCHDFNDIVAANALGRPGPLICDMHREYGKGKENPKSIQYGHKLLEPILKETYGQLIYQEQLIEMSQKLAGFSYKLADKLRKACGKKKKELLDEVKPKFFSGCEQVGVPQNVAKDMWHIAVEFGSYAFNKAHSTAYAEITYQTAYLKTYYPEEFICAILTSMANKSDSDLQESIQKFQKEYKNLKILSPDINESKETYVPTGKKMTIRAPFISLPGVGERVSQHIVPMQKFADITHFLEAVDKTVVNSATIKTFQENGVFDSIGDRQEIELGIKKYEQMDGMVKKKPKKRLGMSPDDLQTEIKQQDLF